MSIAPAILSHYPDLNDAQRSIIGHVDGPLLVIAGPGSGKTYSIVLRALNLLLLGQAQPDEIVLCTFTEKAAFELRDRMAASARTVEFKKDLSELAICTIHGLCNRILTQHRHRTALGHNYDTLDELTQLLFIFEHFDEIIGAAQNDLYLGRWKTRWTAIEGARGYFDKITEELVNASKLVASDDPFLAAIGKAYIAYENALTEANRIDFAHLQRTVLELLQHDAGAASITRRVKYVLVDEYQDTNYVQEQLLLKLIESTRNLCVVGDEDQSLYRFRGATVSALNVAALAAIYEQTDLAEQFRVTLKLEFATTNTQVHQADIGAGELPLAQELLASITTKVADLAKVTNKFAELYPAVREYVARRCFGREIDIDHDSVRSHLARLEVQEGIAKYLARKIAELTIDRRAIEFERSDFRLSETRPFSWRRNLPPLTAGKTIFNYVATYNDFERRFAEFLERAADVLRFAALGTTEQGDSGTQFRVDYLKPSGAIGFYHPDWVVVQKSNRGEINWIIETKGREWEGTTAKDEAMDTWCGRVEGQTGVAWRYTRVNQRDFDARKPRALRDLLTQSKPGDRLLD